MLICFHLTIFRRSQSTQPEQASRNLESNEILCPKGGRRNNERISPLSSERLIRYQRCQVCLFRCLEKYILKNLPRLRNRSLDHHDLMRLVSRGYLLSRMSSSQSRSKLREGRQLNRYYISLTQQRLPQPAHLHHHRQTSNSTPSK